MISGYYTPQIFPKTFSQKIFPAHAMNTRFAIFQKCRIAPFARIPASEPPCYSVPDKRGATTGTRPESPVPDTAKPVTSDTLIILIVISTNHD